MVSFRQMLAEARDLRTEDDSNPEYDRALVELTCRAFGVTVDDLLWVAIEEAIIGGRGGMYDSSRVPRRKDW